MAMYKYFVALIGLALLSCSDNQSVTTTETKIDSTTMSKDSASKNAETNTVTPPASNGQY